MIIDFLTRLEIQPPSPHPETRVDLPPLAAEFVADRRVVCDIQRTIDAIDELRRRGR